MIPREIGIKSLKFKRLQANSLPYIGNYITKINTNLAAKLVNQNDYNQKNSLWSCGDNGDIEFKQLCRTGCVDNGKDDDACNEDEAVEAAAGLPGKRDGRRGWVA